MGCGCKNKVAQGAVAASTQAVAEQRRAQLRELRAKEAAKQNAVAKK